MQGSSGAAAAVLLTMAGIVAALHLLFPGDAASMPATEKPQVVAKSNYECYVCHMPFLQESLAAVHAKVAVWCGTCHGPSIAHIEDENIGATPPDIVFEKHEVDRMCAQCHDPEEHFRLKGNTRSERLAAGQKAQQVVKGRRIRVTGVCTDCHGSHWIPPREQQPRPQPGDGDAGTTSTAPPQEDSAGGARSSVVPDMVFGCNASGCNSPQAGRPARSSISNRRRCRSMVSRFPDRSNRLRVFRRETAGRRVILPRRAGCRLR